MCSSLSCFRRWLFFTWYLFIQLCIRVLYLPSHFTFPCASAASNHKSQANPRVFVVYTLSSYKEHRFLLSRLISPLRYVFPYVHAVQYFHGVCFFTPRRRKIVRKKTYVSFHDIRLLQNALFLQFVVFGLICQISPSFLSGHHRQRDVNAVLCIYETSTIWNTAAIPTQVASYILFSNRLRFIQPRSYFSPACATNICTFRLYFVYTNMSNPVYLIIKILRLRHFIFFAWSIRKYNLYSNNMYVLQVVIFC